MRPPRTLFAAFAGCAVMAVSPVQANEVETVEIQIDLDAPATEIYHSIRKQAWSACKPETGSHYIAARTTARRACQKAMVADVVEQLAAPDVIELAAKDGIRRDS
ncbi:MAG: hypothetical protein AAGL97_08615 [Pseudomonadota bacterium]